MKKNIVGKLITIISVICITFEIGIVLGYYMLARINFDKYHTQEKIKILK